MEALLSHAETLQRSLAKELLPKTDAADRDIPLEPFEPSQDDSQHEST